MILLMLHDWFVSFIVFRIEKLNKNFDFQVEEGWYEGILNGKHGLFPSNYVTRMAEEISKINTLI